MTDRRLKSIKVTGLLDTFDYEISFTGETDTVILIAPNGYGKTAFLSLLNSCLQLQLFDASDHSFRKLEVKFDDETKWVFTKAKPSSDDSSEWMYAHEMRMSGRRVRRRRPLVKVDFLDKKGKTKKDQKLIGFDHIPRDILAAALDYALPVVRESTNMFRDHQRGDRVDISEIVDRYRHVLPEDAEFREYISRFDPGLFQQFGSQVNCVFIETQRLLYTKRVKPPGDQSKEPEEEIIRQSGQLADLLKSTFANYASISQSLDRSFPNRLIEKSQKKGKREIEGLRTDLEAIEARRRALTDAGILLEDAENVIAPKDEVLPSVADALAIYVEDSRQKLATFDEIFPKVSVFRELLSRKLFPKDLMISRDNGAQVSKNKSPVGLERLSSGEKHEFIMLFRLIFETPVNSLVLIDEPEISLHVAWQLEFMSDLQRIQSANRFQSIIATHSPQIIQGAEEIVFDLSEQVK